MASAVSQAQGLSYVEADEFSNLSPAGAITTVTADDDLWLKRAFGVGSTIYESGNEQPPELTQRIDSLTPNSPYDVYVVHWTNASDWTIAGGLTPGQEVIYNRAGPTPYFPTATASTPAAFSQWSAPPPLFQESDRVMVIGKIGTATSNASGQVNVYINDPGGAGTTDARSFYDGVAYAPANAAVTLSATINRTTGNLTLNNPTGANFQVRSISIQSGAGTLNPLNWNSISNTADADSGGSFDSSDIWTVGTSSTSTLAEAEPTTPVVVGGTLAAGATLNFGNIVQKSVYEDVSVVLALDNIDSVTATNDTFRLIANYTGGTPIAPGDFNADGVVDIASDYASLIANLNSGVDAGPSAYERYLSGDMTNNNRVTFADLVLFRQAYDEANGAGAFAAAVGVPEPAGLALAALGFCGLWTSARKRRRAAAAERELQPQAPQDEISNSTPTCKAPTMVRLICSAIAVGCLATLQATVSAAPVTGWAIDPTIGIGRPTDPLPDPALSGAATASPTLGDGTRNNADSVAMFASIPQVTLADGQEITLTGAVTVTGADNPAHGDFRWGLFFEGSGADTLGWRGYMAENASGNNSGTLNVKNPAAAGFATTSFASTANSLGAGISNTINANQDLFVDGVYNFSLTVGRFGGEISARGSLTSASGFSNVYLPGTDPASLNRLTFDFNRVGILAGGNLNSDQMAFSGINVTGPTPIAALTLRVTTSGPNAGLTEIVNSVTGASVDLSYYEITSAGGALDLAGYASLDDQEGSDPLGVGWDESAANSGVFISEANLLGAKSLAVNGSVNLGAAYDAGGLQDLRFQYGLTDGTLVRGLVEYVAGPSNIPGDFNSDNTVNGADLTEWRADFVAHNGGSDADGDSDSDGNDFLIWQRNLGATAATPAAAAVPEPAALTLVAVGLASLGWQRRRRVG